MQHVWPSDAWQLAHGETAMRINEHVDSDEELVPSFYESDSPDSGDDVNDFLPDFEFDTVLPNHMLSFTMLDFNICCTCSDTFCQSLHLKRSPRQN